MNTTIRNPGPGLLVVSKSGQRLAAGDSLPLDETDPVTSRHLDAGRLVRVKPPEPAPRAARTKSPQSGA